MAEEIVSFKDLGKQQLLERCRELEFVDNVEDLKCTRCNRLALEHWYTNCGHALCPNCKRLLSGGRCRCPHCGQFIQHIEEQNADFEERVNGLQVKCPNSRYGCLLQTTVKLIMGHLVVCEWTKEHVLPAAYRGTNTTQMLLEEVSKLKMQIGDMHGTIEFLLNELHKQQEVEDDIKASVEMSVADIKSRLNGLSSDLHFETATLKAQTKNINFEQLQIQFSSKEEVKQQEQQLTKLDGKTNVMFQILDEKLDKFSQRLTKEIETLYAKIKAGEDKMQGMRDEDKICMDNFQQKQIGVIANYKQELFVNSKDLQENVEKSIDDLNIEFHKLSSGLTLGLEKQEASFNQKLSLEVKQLEEKILKNKLQFDEECKENGVKIEAMINDVKKQEVVLMKQSQQEAKDFVSKEKFKQLQETVAKLKGSNKILIQMMEMKEDRFSLKLKKEVEAIDTKLVTSEGKMTAALTENRQETAAIYKNLQGKISESIDEIKQQLVEVKADVIEGQIQEETRYNQKLVEVNPKNEIDKKMKNGFDKQEVAVENCRKEMTTFSEEIKNEIQLGQQEVESHIKGSEEKSTEQFNNQFKQLSFQFWEKIDKMSHDVENKTEKLKEETDQLNKKTIKIKKAIEEIYNFLLEEDYKTTVETIQQLNPKLNAIETFKRGIAIERLVNRKSSQSQLVDSFLFGLRKEQMVFESLCFKAAITHKRLLELIPEEGRCDCTNGIFPVYRYQLKTQLKLIIKSNGDIIFNMCFKDEERKGQEVDIKPLPMVTFIIKDPSGHNRHLIRYKYYSFNNSLKYDQFDHGSYKIEKSQWNALFSPHAKSLEVLVLVEPPAIINKPLSVEGTITDTIDHYSRRLQMAKEKLIDGHWSPCFLTHAEGYRVAVKMWWNWSIDYYKKGLVAGIRFLSGEFDYQLGKEFNHETSVTLINQLDVNKNITVKQQSKTTNVYYMDVADENAICSGSFLVNDSLTYHVTIKPIK